MLHRLRLGSGVLAALMLAACASTPQQGEDASASENQQAQRQAMADDAFRDEPMRRCQQDGTRRSAEQDEQCESRRTSGPLDETTNTLEGTGVTRPLGSIGQGRELF